MIKVSYPKDRFFFSLHRVISDTAVVVRENTLGISYSFSDPVPMVPEILK